MPIRISYFQICCHFTHSSVPRPRFRSSMLWLLMKLQDLLGPDVLDLLGTVLKGGIAGGQWYLLGIDSAMHLRRPFP